MLCIDEPEINKGALVYSASVLSWFTPHYTTLWRSKLPLIDSDY